MWGRRKQADEDPFAALRDGATYQSEPAVISQAGLGGLGTESTPPAGPTPAPAVAPVARLTVPSPTLATPSQPQPPATPAFMQPSRLRAGRPVVVVRSRGRPGVLLAVLAVVAIGVAIPVITATSISNSVNAVTFSTPAGPTSGTTQPTPAAPAPLSYLSPAGLRQGLLRVAQIAPRASLTLLRIDANSLNVSAALPSGAVRQIYFGPSGTFVSAGAANTGMRPIPIGQIKPNAVARIVSQMRTRYHIAPGQIDYMVISSPAGLPAQWIVFANTAAHPGWSATLSGAHLTRLGG